MIQMPVLAAEVDQRLQFLAACGPAERIGGRGEHDRARARVAGGEELLEIEPPVAVLEIERDGARLAAGDLDRLADVRPLRLDIDDVRAGIDDEIERQEDRLHAARRDRRAEHRNVLPVQLRQVGGERLGQRRQAAHVGDIEGVAGVERRLGGIADEFRRDEIALAIPERDDVRDRFRANRQLRDVLRLQVHDLRADVLIGGRRERCDRGWASARDSTKRRNSSSLKNFGIRASLPSRATAG